MKNDNVLRIGAYLIVGLLTINFFFFKNLLADSKQEDINLRDKISSIDKKYETKTDKLFQVTSDNKSDVALVKNDINHIKGALDDIKDLLEKK